MREAITLLDLDVMIYPCPKGGPTYRPKAVQLSGRSQFPFLVDPNTGRGLKQPLSWTPPLVILVHMIRRRVCQPRLSWQRSKQVHAFGHTTVGKTLHRIALHRISLVH